MRKILPICLMLLIFSCQPVEEHNGIEISNKEAIDSTMQLFIDGEHYPFIYTRLEDKSGSVLYEKTTKNTRLLADQKVDGNTRPARHVHRSATDAPSAPRGGRGGDQRRRDERQCRQSSVQINPAATESKEEPKWKRRRRRHCWTRPWYAWIFVFYLVPLLCMFRCFPRHFDAAVVGNMRRRDIQQRHHSRERMHLEHRPMGSF